MGADHPIMGSFYIPHQEQSTFIDLYLAALRDCHHLSLIETHKTISPVLIDLDFRQTSSDRLYTQETIDTLVTDLTHIISRYVSQPSYTCYVLEKPAPRPHPKDTTLWKDGLHLHFPDVITHPAIQYAIRKDFLDEVHCMTFDPFTNDPQQIYDQDVIEKNGWFMYGSRKPSGQPNHQTAFGGKNKSKLTRENARKLAKIHKESRVH